MKKLAFILMFIMIFGALTACEAEKTEQQETAQQEAEQVKNFEMEDIVGCWYGENAEGERYLIRLYTHETAAGTDCYFSMNAYSSDKTKSLFGNVYMGQDETTGTSCTLAAHMVGGERTEEVKLGIGTLYDDGSFAYMPQYVEVDDNGHAFADTDRMESEKILFTREFDAPALKVDREDGKISGVWFAREGEEFFILELYESGHFSLYQEGEMVYGTYKNENDKLSLTAKIVEGEAYEGDDATVTVTIDGDDNIVAGKKVINPVNGGITAKYTSEDGFTLELFEDGMFYMNRTDNQAVGVYAKDENGFILCALAGAARAEKELCIAETIDGDALSFYFVSEGGDERIIFKK